MTEVIALIERELLAAKKLFCHIEDELTFSFSSSQCQLQESLFCEIDALWRKLESIRHTRMRTSFDELISREQNLAELDEMVQASLGSVLKWLPELMRFKDEHDNALTAYGTWQGSRDAFDRYLRLEREFLVAAKLRNRILHSTMSNLLQSS